MATNTMSQGSEWYEDWMKMTHIGPQVVALLGDEAYWKRCELVGVSVSLGMDFGISNVQIRFVIILSCCYLSMQIWNSQILL